MIKMAIIFIRISTPLNAFVPSPKSNKLLKNRFTALQNLSQAVVSTFVGFST